MQQPHSHISKPRSDHPIEDATLKHPRHARSTRPTSSQSASLQTASSPSRKRKKVLHQLLEESTPPVAGVTPASIPFRCWACAITRHLKKCRTIISIIFLSIACSIDLQFVGILAEPYVLCRCFDFLLSSSSTVCYELLKSGECSKHGCFLIPAIAS